MYTSKGDVFMDYIFMTDSSCDLSDEIAKELNVEILPMEFSMEDKSYLHYADARMMSLDDFYSKLKSGINSKTTQINYNSFINYFEPYLKAGKDILYTGICSGLSGTYNTCLMAVKDLQEKYPDRKIVIIDSMCDSVGLGLLIYLAGQKYLLESQLIADHPKPQQSTYRHYYLQRRLKSWRFAALWVTAV